MQPETEKLLEKLRVITKELSSGGNPIGSEGDYPLIPLVWSSKEQGECSLSKLLLSLGLLRPIGLDDFIPRWECKFISCNISGELSEQYQFLIQIWQSGLKNVQAYELKNYDNIYNYGALQILVGQTVEGDWVGITLPVSGTFDPCQYGEPLYREQHQPQTIALALKTQLEPILRHLQPSGFLWQVANQEAILIEQLLESAHVLNCWQFKRFYDDSFDGIDRDDGYVEFEEFINGYLINPLLYVLGNRELFDSYLIYLIGENEFGDFLGIRTEAIWTG